jgi:flagellar biogenesis protein FliO
VWLTSEGTRKQLTFRFEDKVFDPILTRQAKSISIDFAMPMASNLAPAPVSAAPAPMTGAYAGMFVALAIVVAIILLLYGVMKYFFKHNVVTDIPGIGRLLGKIDLEMKKSIVFYELGEVIYMIGITDGSITLMDKVTDPTAVNLIKAGFSRRKDFSSYMKFFRKKNEIGDDFKDSSALIEEKLSSLRKK